MPLPTILDIAKANGNDQLVGLVDETIQAHPELTLIPADTISGLKYKTLVRTALGNSGGSFRNANEGTDPISHTYENREFETYILNPRFEIDKANADKYEKGAPAYIALQQSGTLEGEMQALATQFYYGTVVGSFGNAKAFPGLLQMYDAANMTVDAAGTTANTGSSVWLVRYGPQAVRWLFGQDGAMEMSPLRVESITGTNNKKLDGYVQTLLAYPGLQSVNLLSVVRIKNLTADANKGLTDDLIYDALSLFPAGSKPDVILLNRRSLKQLRASRTATNATGASAPIPPEVEGIPLAVTDAIRSTEPIT